MQPVGYNWFQEQSGGDVEKDHLRDQLLEVKEHNEKMEGLLNFLEQEKIRLHEKIEKMMAAGKQLFDWNLSLKQLSMLDFNTLLTLMLYPRKRPGTGVGDYAH